MQLTPEGNRVRFENGRGEVIYLTPDEVGKLVLHAPKILRELASPDPKYKPVPTIGAKNSIVSLDAHHTVVILQIEREDGELIGYLIQPDTARELQDALGRKIEQIEEASAKKTTQ
jgi:hypothetical protein